jgi:very-short-patch-repair endonuclease
VQRDEVLQERARRLRQRATPDERDLWAALRAWRLDGVKFSRQVPIGPYIADFAARRLKLIIEIDGTSHDGREAYDARRDAWLAANGYRVLRFTDEQLSTSLMPAIAAIRAAIADLA